ncbi:MAG: DUF86 domain-containing protein [Nitrospira sp. BO4]|jgi:uncharacterized protein with HEPN domain|nr:DUF86 domain-containing protein [Nitrospira sp. BO4]
MPRDSSVYLEDILEATRKIASYTANLSKAAFLEDEKTFDAVVRNLEVIGEAVKRLPEDFRAQHPALEWKKMAGPYRSNPLRGQGQDVKDSPLPLPSSP